MNRTIAEANGAPFPEDLFGRAAPCAAGEAAPPGLHVLRGFVCPREDAVLAALDSIREEAPPRRMSTPGGRAMSVAMTNCGPLGWVSDSRGYRYQPTDPMTGRPWPPMPPVLALLAASAAERAGFADFAPDACLVNHYRPGDRMGLHQDRDESDFAHPIVSVSLGLPAVFLFGGLQRGGRPHRVELQHGDVVVWGGADRLRYHGVAPVKPGRHPRLGELRVNLTLRRAR